MLKNILKEQNHYFVLGSTGILATTKGSTLDYNQDSHRQRLINWIDGTGQLSTAFDFTTKGILQEAVKGDFWRLRDPQGKPPGVIGWWLSSSVTFVDNHDTGSTQAHWPFPKDHIMEIDIRKRQGIQSRLPVRILEAKHDLYSALINRREGVHEDWKWFMVPNWEGMDTINFWSQLRCVA